MKVTEFIVGFAPNETVSAKFELLLACAIDEVGCGDDLINTVTDKLFFRRKFCFVLVDVEVAELIVFRGIGKGEEGVFLIEGKGTGVDVGDGQSLAIVVQLQYARDDVVANVEGDQIAIDSAHEDRVSGSRAEGARQTPFTTDVAAHGLGFETYVLDAEIAFCCDVAEALIFE